jgi:hypothetical protein
MAPAPIHGQPAKITQVVQELQESGRISEVGGFQELQNERPIATARIFWLSKNSVKFVVDSTLAFTIHLD